MFRINKKIYVGLILLVFITAFILRFYKLGEVPNGLYRDETAIGYNAYSILETGKDEHNNYLPTYFKSFGDHKLPAYIYLTSASIKIFGLNALAVRFPSALLGSLSVILLYFLIKEFTKDRWLPLIASFFLAINPWHLHFSRAGFEVNAALFFSLLGSFSFIKGIQTKKYWFVYISVFSFVLALYSYNVTRLLAPLLFLTLVVLYRKDIMSIDKKHFLGVILWGSLLLLPFLISFFSRSGVASAKGALITSTDIEASFIEMRSYLIGYPSILTKIFFNKWILLLFTYGQNIVASLSPTFYFITGSSHGNQGIGNMGVFYLFQFPFFIAGIVYFFKNNFKNLSLFLIWLILALLTLSLSKEVPHATRGYFITIPVTLFSALGLITMWNIFSKKLSIRIKLTLFITLSGVILFHVVFYLASYYERFPVTYTKSWNQQDAQLSLYLQEEAKNYNKIIIDSESGFPYTSLLFFTKYNPNDFLKTVERYPDDSEGFSKVKSFGKYEFREIDWDKDYANSKNTLFVTLEDRKPKDITTFKMFYYPTRQVVISDKETIISFPYDEPAYVVIKSP